MSFLGRPNALAISSACLVTSDVEAPKTSFVFEIVSPRSIAPLIPFEKNPTTGDRPAASAPPSPESGAAMLTPTEDPNALTCLLAAPRPWVSFVRFVDMPMEIAPMAPWP